MKVTELAHPDEWPDPAEAAEKFRDFHDRPEDGRGVLLDALIDERIRMKDTRHHYQEVIIHLDYVADSLSPNARMLDEVSKLHRHVIELHDWAEDYEREIDSILDEVRADDG